MNTVETLLGALLLLLSFSGTAARLHHSHNAHHHNVARNVSLAPVPHNGSELYKPLFAIHTNSTPRFLNETRKETNALVEAAVALGKGQSSNTRSLHRLQTRAEDQPEGTCGPGAPCKNKACCRKDGVCGYCDEFCESKVCISNCDAQAECGKCAPKGKGSCPLKVCCSQYGFCGTTPEFCDDKCQKDFGGCGKAPKPSCGGTSSKKRNIAYYESWAATRACDKRDPEDINLAGITHLNFAFAYFNPTSFQMTSMDANAAKLYTRFTNLKMKHSSLETWIAIGGWAFNDETNTPNTRTAFSDMAASPARRKTFIDSLLMFMRTYGFDGADLDWEYPGAEDRGGKAADSDNFIKLVKEIKEAFGGKYGLTVTLPASYWYLRWFKVKEMEPYVSWFNVMTYDIHGIWDSEIKSIGPYVRPHTNLTEIDEGLQLLWRAGVKPENVVLGLGWYGRSFTLTDPTCTKPGCHFSGGAKPGPCSKTSGVLTLAEIKRIIKEKNAKPVFDKEAGVNYIVWDSNQWVSYDDDKTFKMKRDFADKSCLGGTMIWAIDQDAEDGSGLGDTLDRNQIGIFAPDLASTDKYPFDAAAAAQMNGKIIELLETLQRGLACYTTFCTGQCQKGYESITMTHGQVADFMFPTECKNNGGSIKQFQRVCCANSALLPSGEGIGRCHWRGWNGVGLACNRGCESNEVEVAANSKIREFAGECAGGYMSYCCSNYTLGLLAGSPSNILEAGHYEADHATELTKREMDARKSERGLWLIEGRKIDVSDYGGSTLESEGAIRIEDMWSSPSGLDHIVGMGIGKPVRGKKYGPGGSNSKNGRNKNKIPGALKGSPPKVKTNAAGARIYGPYTKAVYDPKKHIDCAVTYTCAYGKGFDEVCDNQRYGVSEVRGGRTVYNRKGSGNLGARMQTRWAGQHHPNYRNWGKVTGSYGGGPKTRCHCEGDEFPMAGLAEAWGGQEQAVRQVDGLQNGAQGQDFMQWDLAYYKPCESLRRALGKPKPPITWAFNMAALPANDPRRTANGFIAKYGFNSQNPVNRCFARFTAGGVGFTVSDHHFRVDMQDRMTSSPFSWNSGSTQDWRPDPLTLGRTLTSVDSASWVRKRDDGEEEVYNGPVATGQPDSQLEDGDWPLDWDYESPPPPEPSHLESPPSRVKRAMLQGEDPEAVPASRARSSSPVQTGDVDADAIVKKGVEDAKPKVESKDGEEGFTEWNNATVIDGLMMQRREDMSCEDGDLMEIGFEDWDQRFGFCDCIGWS